MPLELHPLQESDLDDYYEIVWQAFKDDIMALLYPNGFSQAAREHIKASTLKKWRTNADTNNHMKAVDTDLPDTAPFGKIVGIAYWIFYPNERSEAEMKADEEKGLEDGFTPGANAPFIKAFFGAIGKCKKEILGGRPYVLLQMLGTHPSHHRRGVGAMHLKWGFERADELGLPVYLEASPAGTPLYARMGFDTVGWLPFDVKEWGGKKDIPHALMLRPAKTVEKE